MKYTYLLVYDEDFMTYEEAKDFLNVHVARREVDEWLYILDNCFLLVSTISANSIGLLLLAYTKKNQDKEKPDGHFIIVEPAADRQGYLPRAAWNMLRYKSTTKPPEPVDALRAAGDLDDEIPF